MLPGVTRKARFKSEELEPIQAATGRNYELVRGELYEVMPPTMRHGEIAGEIHGLIRAWVRRTGGGRVSVEGGFTLERGPDTVRGPDVSFVQKGRLTREQSRRGFPDIAPDLAVEIRSPDQSWRELEEKAREYFAAGTRMVWFVEMDAFLEILWPDGQRRRLGSHETVEVDDLLPGFRCQVRDFFPEETD